MIGSHQLFLRGVHTHAVCVESPFLTSEIRTISRDQDKESSFGQIFLLL